MKRMIIHSIRLKIILLVMAITLVVFLAIWAVMVFYLSQTMRRNLQEHLTSLADMVAHTSASALMFKDPYAARETLSALRAEPQVRSALILDLEGRLFAQYGSSDGVELINAKSGKEMLEEKDLLFVSRSIIHKKEHQGSIVILASLENLSRMLHKAILAFLGSLAGGLVLAFILSASLQRLITEPIFALKEMTCRIRRGNLDSRVFVYSKDELGDLADSFNQMAIQLESNRQEIQKYARELEGKVQHRTMEITRAYEELKQAQSGLLQAEKLASIGELAAGVAHEINNPMGFIKSNYDTLNRHLASLNEFFRTLQSGADREALANKAMELRTAYIMDDIRALMKDNADGIDRIIEIVHGLKDFSRLDQAEDISPANLNGNIRSALLMVQNQLKYAAEVRLELGDIRPVPCNSRQINQVLLNLLINAAQAIKSQRRPELGRIIIRTFEDEKRVYCEVGDDGPGIPADLQGRIFQPFFTTKEAGKGTGLGLSISYDIVVNRHGGELRMRSEEGKGAAFTIVLPKNNGKAVAKPL